MVRVSGATRNVTPFNTRYFSKLAVNDRVMPKLQLPVLCGGIEFT